MKSSLSYSLIASLFGANFAATAGCSGAVESTPSVADGGVIDAGSTSQDGAPANGDGATGADAPSVSDASNDATAPLCTQSQRDARLAQSFEMPILPLRGLAGLDIRGPNMQGLTLADAESLLCQSDDGGDLFGDGQKVATWGSNQEVWLHYNVTTKRALGLHAFGGYHGSIVAQSSGGTHQYEIPLTAQIRKDGVPVVINWGDDTALAMLADELYRALAFSFAPQLPQDPPSTTCVASTKCTHGAFGKTAYIYFRALGVGLWVVDSTAPQPAASILTRIDITQPM